MKEEAIDGKMKVSTSILHIILNNQGSIYSIFMIIFLVHGRNRMRHDSIEEKLPMVSFTSLVELS